MRGRRGFTLLEVMVAVAILGLGLTAILSAQAGAFAASAHARNISLATGLARCKMSELEEHVMRDGFQQLAESDTGPCCEGDETPGVHCTWSLDPPELPEPKLGELDLDAQLGSSSSGGPLAALGSGEQSLDSLGPDAGLGAIAQSLIGGATGDPSSAAGAGGIASMAMGMVYPDLKLLFEASLRRATVKLTWTEGVKEYSLELVQWLAMPQQSMAVDQALLNADSEVQDQAEAAASGSKSGSGSGMGSSGRPNGGGSGTKPSGGGSRPGPTLGPRPKGKP